MENLKMHTPDLAEENYRKLAELFPNAVTETITGYDEDGKAIIERAIDADVLRQEIAAQVVEGSQERYQFTWPDKKRSVVLANQPIAKTLRLVREKSVGRDGTPGSIDTENIYIEGDNLDVLKLLQETYLGKVKIIYIDPPYNTGTDTFVYDDDSSISGEEFSERSGQYDEEGNQLFDIRMNNESNGRFHTDWLNMLYPRLRIAKDFLSDDGVIFISIDDNEAANLVKICNEIFGQDCFVCSAIWRSSDNSNNDAKQFSTDHNYTLVYSKRPLWQPEKIQDESKRKHFKNPDNDPKGPWFDGNPLNSPNYRENLRYTITAPNGNIIEPPKNGWRWSQETLKKKMESGEIYFNTDQTNIKRRTYLCDMEGLPPSTLWVDLEVTGHNRQAKYELLKLMPEDVFDTPKPVKLIKYIIRLVRENSDAVIMDYFSGSGTTADAVMQMNAQDNGNRKFIMVQLPEDLDEGLLQAANDKKRALQNAIKFCDENGVPHVLSEIARERIYRAGKTIREESPLTTGELDTGFRVFRVDSSNMKDVYYRPKDFKQGQMNLFADNIKEDRTPEDLLIQVMLDLSVLLSSKIEETVIAGKKVFSVADGYLIACFDKDVTEETVKAIAQQHPFYAVFRDSGMATDSVMTNFEQIFETYSPKTVRRVL